MTMAVVTLKIRYPINTQNYVTEENPNPTDMECVEIDRMQFGGDLEHLEDLVGAASEIEQTWDVEA